MSSSFICLLWFGRVCAGCAQGVRVGIADAEVIAAVAAQRAAMAGVVGFVHGHPELAHEERLCAAQFILIGDHRSLSPLSGRESDRLGAQGPSKRGVTCGARISHSGAQLMPQP